MDIPVAKSRTSLKHPYVKTGLVVLGLCATAALSTLWFKPAVPSVKSADVWISQVKQGDFTRKVRGVGVLVPSQIRWIAAATPGRVERVLVKPGALVTTQTVIAELSNPELINQRAQAQWEYDAAQANLLALEAQLQEQTLEQELLVTQAKMALQSAQLMEKAELDIRLQTQQHRADVISAKLDAERANVRKFKNMVNHFKTQMDALKVYSDIDGVLQQISVDVGQRVEIGGNIARVARPDSLLAELQVQENRVQDLQLGFPVTIDTRNGLVDGIVKRIDPRVLNGNVQVDVELTGELPSGARPDLSVTGTIVVEHIKDTLYIDRPAGAVALSDTSLFTLDTEQQVAQQRNIRLGKASVSSIQVVAGLQPSDAVIVSDMSEFNQHSAIKLVQ